MTLATRCPWCETVFRLDKEQAAQRAGMVRCGICGHTFNALDYLVRGTDLGGHAERLLAASAAAKRAAPAAVRPQSAPTAASRPPAAPTPAPVTAPVAPATAPPKWSPSSEDDNSIELERIQGDRRFDDDPDVEDPAIGRGRMAEPGFMRHARDEEREPMSRMAIAGWTALNLIALIALFGQLAYFWRAEVYAAFPAASAMVTQACSTLGCDAQPPADIDMITIESSSLEPSNARADLITFSTLLRNHSDVAQRYPAIELTLTDSEDHPTVRRVLTPAEYLPASDALHRDGSLPANSELNVKLPLQITGVSVVGYRTRVFYP